MLPVAGFTSSPGSTLTIINGDTTTGTFASYAEGSVTTLGGQSFSITYHGGAGNNVVLTNVSIPQVATTVTLSTSATSVESGQSVVVTAQVAPVWPSTAVPSVGAVTLMDGSTPLGTAALSSGHDTQVVYAAGDVVTVAECNSPSHCKPSAITF